MNLDLYTLTAFFVGILAGAVAGFWLARFITGLTVERLERKVQSLSDNKFELKGQRARLRQLEQRLDAEAARIPLAERELKEKSGEIRELTNALNETTSLTSELTAALRTRKAKVQQLQVEQSKWLKRNKALLMKTQATEEQLAEINNGIAQSRNTNGTLELQISSPGDADQPTLKDAQENVNLASTGENALTNGTAERLTSRMQQMESDLESWFDRIGKLEANVTGQMGQASGLTLLEQVLRGEAQKQEDAATDDVPNLLGKRNAS